MLAVLGVLKNETGLKIKKEMLSWMEKEHEVLCIEQEPPGKEFEYPGIKTTLKLSVEMNEPVLYLHTKGAGNIIPKNYKTTMMNPDIIFPKEAQPEDCQRIVRLMWKKEFSGERIKDYLKKIDTAEPYIICPYAGPNRVTWQNGWIINPSAAKIAIMKFHKSNNRYYFENFLQEMPEIKLYGTILNDFNWNEKSHKRMWDSIWSFYDNSIKNMV